MTGSSSIPVASSVSANPAITAKAHLATDPAQIAFELEAFTRKRLGIREDPPSPFPLALSAFPSAMGVVAAAGDSRGAMWGIKRAAQGTAVVLDWLGAGGNPVSRELAEKRAAVCVACPLNETGSWYTEAPAEVIRAAVKAWQTLKGSSFAFETSQGDKLKSCAVCKCKLPLKVFVGLDHIVQKTKPEVMAELPSHCWITRRDQ